MSHHSKSVWVLGGLLVAVSQVSAAGAESLLVQVGRNPFERISTASCDDDRKTLAGWRLQGIVRGADYHIGWVQRSEGQWQKVAIETRLLPYWQVTHISERQASLQHVNSERPCSGSSGSMVLSMR
ncbi:DNA utilization family protein [Yersinia proxima]|uniref:DNA utilization family protein n=1 Tax=Yersinia proxima TaxID=2890316 RepID=UPI0009863341|nr:DNA utilization family protein [Yersinia proxima]